jgi:rhodanese-related sulfurtransferase
MAAAALIARPVVMDHGDHHRPERTPMATDTTTPVTEHPPAEAAAAAAHFGALLAFETDCWDVHTALDSGTAGFVLLDVRGEAAYRAGHVAGAIHLPHRSLTEETLAAYPPETLFVVYCAGPHCNGADRAALRLARLGRPVKKMIGGVEGWKDEGFELVADGDPERTVRRLPLAADPLRP